MKVLVLALVLVAAQVAVARPQAAAPAQAPAAVASPEAPAQEPAAPVVTDVKVNGKDAKKIVTTDVADDKDLYVVNLDKAKTWNDAKAACAAFAPAGKWSLPAPADAGLAIDAKVKLGDGYTFGANQVLFTWVTFGDDAEDQKVLANTAKAILNFSNFFDLAGIPGEIQKGTDQVAAKVAELEADKNADGTAKPENVAKIADLKDRLEKLKELLGNVANGVTVTCTSVEPGI